MTFRLMLALLMLLAGSATAQVRTVWMETTYGPMMLELDEGAAPITVENFLAYVEEGFYDGMIFHRVVEDFVVQSGTFDDQLNAPDPTRPAIQSERNNGLANVYGSIAMALAGVPPQVDSGRAAFYINTGTNDFLDDNFTVFGAVSRGLETLERMNATRAGTLSGLLNYPAVPPQIIRAFETDGYPMLPLHTGSWFDPLNPGRGLNIEIANPGQADAEATLVIYLYDFIGGGQFWLVGSANFDFGPSAVTVPMFIVDGPEFGDAFDPDDRNVAEWGTITFEVTGCDTAVMTYESLDFGSGERPLSRLTRPNDLDSCDGL